MRGLISLFLLLAGAAAAAGELPRATPEEVGLSSDGLARIGNLIEGEVAAKDYPGAVVLVARHGKIAYLRTFGALGPDGKAGMPADAIFRIFSMSKAITSVAAMTLVEEGKLGLDDPVSKYLPAFKDQKVAVEGGLVPAEQPATIQDLMRHTSGMAYGFLYRTPVQKLYAKAGLWDDGLTNAALADRVARLPLDRQPGTAWEYGHSTDVLGRVIEAVSGQSLFAFEKERILDPLEMKDTAFRVEGPAKQARIAEPFAADARFGREDGIVEFSDPRAAKLAESGGAGMVSTALDYARFLQMLLNGGSLDGHRVLGSRTVSYMTADHIGSRIAPPPFPGYGWSLAFAVRREAGISPMPGSVGDYFWYSAGGGSYWVDPKEDMLVIFLANKPSEMERHQAQLRQIVYGAILH